MSNNSNNPYSSNSWGSQDGPVNGDLTWSKKGGSWGTNTSSTETPFGLPTQVTNKVDGHEWSASATANQYGAVVDVSGTSADQQLRTSTEGKYGGVWTAINENSYSASGHAGVTQNGYGAQGGVSWVGRQEQISAELGDAHTGGIGGYVDGKAFVLQAKGQALWGDDGRYQGVALGGMAQASVLDATAGANVTYPLDWAPFVPKGWTINIKGEAEGKAGNASIAGGGYLYRDRADGRGHFGLYAGIGLLLGGFLGADISIGPGMTPEQKKAADEAAAKQAAADAKAAAAALVRPIARITDPIGAHSSHFWAYLAMAAVIALTVVACCFCPALILGAGTLASAAIATLTTVSVATGVMQVAGAYVDAKTNPAKMEESGSPCSEITSGAKKTKIEKLFVARIEDTNGDGSGKLKTGAEKVWVEKHPVSRVGEASTCGATKVLKGAKKTLAGGPSCTSGAPNEPGVADDAFFEGTLDVLGKISLWTGVAAGVGGALRAGVMTAAKATVMAGVKTTVKSLAVQGAVMTSMHYATPMISDGLQSALGVDKVTADAITNGTLMAGGGVLHATGGGKPGTTWKSGVADVKASAAETGTSAMNMLGKGKASAMDMLGMGSKAEPTTTPTAANDNVAGSAVPAPEAVTAPVVEAPEVATPVKSAAAPEVAPVETGPAPIDAANLEFHSQLKVDDVILGSDRATLEAATTDPAVAQRLADQAGVSPNRIQRDAAIVLSRDHAGELVAGEVRSAKDFDYEAQVSGHQVETLDHVYRLDGRPPEQIAAEGFSPNPSKEAGTLMEHVAEQVSGTGSYVSTSSEAANTGTLLNTDFFPTELKSGSESLTKWVEGGAGGPERTPLNDLEYVAREYRISNVDGVKLRDGVGVAAEKEVVIRGANPEQIEYREITIKRRFTETEEVDSDGSWFTYDLTPIKKISLDDVSISEWNPLPKVENVSRPISDPPAPKGTGAGESAGAGASASKSAGVGAGKSAGEGNSTGASESTGASASAGAGEAAKPTAAADSPACATCSGATAAKPGAVDAA